MPEEIQNGQEEAQLQSEEQLEEVSTSEEPTEEAPEETQEPELPEDAKERTKREFEKLKANNAELKRQLEEQQNLPSVLDYPGFEVPQVSPQVRQQYMQPVAMQQSYQQAPPEPKLVDEHGYVNADVLQMQLNKAEEARRRAEEAERRATEAQQRIAKFEQTAEEKALYSEFPELDPFNQSFNRDAYELVRNELTSQIINTGKRDAISAAQKMSRYFRTPAKQKVLEQRKQASTVSGNQPRQMGTDLDELRLRSRTDPNAVAERLKRLGL